MRLSDLTLKTIPDFYAARRLLQSLIFYRSPFSTMRPILFEPVQRRLEKSASEFGSSFKLKKFASSISPTPSLIFTGVKSPIFGSVFDCHRL